MFVNSNGFQNGNSTNDRLINHLDWKLGCLCFNGVITYIFYWEKKIKKPKYKWFIFIHFCILYNYKKNSKKKKKELQVEDFAS